MFLIAITLPHTYVSQDTDNYVRLAFQGQSDFENLVKRRLRIQVEHQPPREVYLAHWIEM